MPKALHRKLEKKASEKGLTGARRDAYVYGTLYKAEHGGKGKKKKR